MITTPVQHVFQTADARPTPATRERFESAMAAVSATTDSGRIRQAAEQLVATSLVQPVLASMMNSPFREGPFAPGSIEKRFMPLLHRHLSDRIVQSSNFNLVDMLTQQLIPTGSTVEVSA